MINKILITGANGFSAKALINELKKINVNDVKTIDMAQGNKVSRIVAWTFLTKIEQNEWRENRWK